MSKIDYQKIEKMDIIFHQLRLKPLILCLTKHIFLLLETPIFIFMLYNHIHLLFPVILTKNLNVIQHCVTIEHFFVDLDKIRCILDPILSMWKCSLHFSFGWHEN